MILPYDEILLERAELSLGRMLDYAVHSLHLNADSFISLFISSGMASLFESGDACVIAGMSGTEAACRVMEESGLSYERIAPRHTSRVSAEFHCGQALALLQWSKRITFDRLTAILRPSELIAEYTRMHFAAMAEMPWNADEEFKQNLLDDLKIRYLSEATALFESRIKATKGAASLKSLRIKNGLSQSQLAAAASVPIRTLQQYEQGQKDIRKAGASVLLALAAALHSNPEDLIT